MARVYLDWNATAPLHPAVRGAMVKAMDASYGNASSVHQEGQRSRSIIERARRAVAKSVNAPAQSVVFTSGATEANNMVLRHHARSVDDAFIVCSAVEHPSVLEVVEDLAQAGTRTAIVGVDEQGRIDRDAFAALVEQGATLCSVMLANNEIGNVFPVRQFADVAHAGGAVLHVDATQGYGRIPIDFAELEADLLTLSFHKAGGPKGIGAIVMREGIKIEPLFAGGHQERGRRPGTENVTAASGVDALAKLVKAGVATEELEAKRALLLEALAGAEPELRGDQARRLPNTLNVAFAGIDGEDLLLALDLEGVAASSGSACTAGSLEPSHVILAMQYDEADAKRSVRFSFGPTTTEQELTAAAHTIVSCVGRLQRI